MLKSAILKPLLDKLLKACLLSLCLIPSAWADDSQPLYIEINEKPLAANIKQEHHYQLGLRLPASYKLNNLPTIIFPDTCQQQSLPSAIGAANRSSATQSQKHYRCQQSLSGQAIQIRFPQFNPSSSTLIKYRALNGEQHTRLLSPSESSWILPLAETPSRIIQDYTVLGIQHILAGTDHLLFVLCLLWIAGSLRRVLITITGFTLAHSFTLVLSALEWVRLPVPPVEAVIALSIVFLATEIIKDNKKTLTWRYPIAVSSSFGLLHGFGFAAALAEIGLPQTELMTGLLFFNVGVEIGQVVFALVVLAAAGLISRIIMPRFNNVKVQHAARFGLAYLIGGLASFWLVERSVGFLG